MSICKLVTGIISIVFVTFIGFQSCAVFISNSKTTDDVAGIFVALLLLAIGIVSIVTRNKNVKGGCLAIIIMSIIACYIGFTNHNTYKDLLIWSIWCAICGSISFIHLIIIEK